MDETRIMLAFGAAAMLFALGVNHVLGLILALH